MSTIILNRMYVGSYLDEDGNIGHEVINLFKDDNGSNYIYVSEDGRINEKYDDDVEAIILVKRVETDVLEVVAKAEELEQIFYKKGYIKDKDERKEAEVKEDNKFIESEQITYGGVLLSDIYKNGYDELKITFKTDKLRTVQEPVFLIRDESKRYKYKNHYFLPEKNFARQKLRMYYHKKEYPQDYEILERLLNNPEIWNEENTTEKINLDEIYTYDSHEGFLSVIKKEDDELIISNLFSYIFNQKKDVFIDFVKEVLNIKDFKGNYTIFREKDNIDLLIENEDHIIIIENKIKSMINGVNSKSSEKIKSQLSKYVNYAYDKYDNYDKDHLHFYIFAPNYNQIDLENYECGEEYDLINYSMIYEFYCKNACRMLNIEYFKEFINALEIHKERTDNSNFKNMKKLFLENILKLKNED